MPVAKDTRSSISLIVLTDEEDCRSLASTCIANVTEKRKRTVQFNADVLVEKFSSTFPTNNDKLYYKKEEYATFRESGKEQTFAVEYMPENHPDGRYYHTIAALHRACRKQKALSPQLESELAGLGESSSLFGLERMAVRDIRQSKKESLEEMMNQIQEIQDDVLLEEDDKAEMIREQCERISLASRVFAMHLAKF